MRQANLFPTIVQEYDLSNDPDLDLVKQLIAVHKTKPHGLLHGAESSYNLFEKQFLDIPELAGFKQRLQDCVDSYISNMGIKPVSISSNWFNKMGRGQRVDNHRHEMSVVSGAFYVDADPGSVPLTLHSPIAAFKMFDFIQQPNFNSANHFDIDCVPGKLIIFPSWLEHSTDVNATDNRITISFNTVYKGYINS